MGGCSIRKGYLVLIAVFFVLFSSVAICTASHNEIRFNLGYGYGEYDDTFFNEDVNELDYGLGYTFYFPGLKASDDAGNQPRKLRPFLQHPSRASFNYSGFRRDWDVSTDFDRDTIALAGKFYLPSSEWATGFGLSYAKSDYSTNIDYDSKELKLSIDQYILGTINVSLTHERDDSGGLTNNWEKTGNYLTARGFFFDLLWLSLGYEDGEYDYSISSTREFDQIDLEVGFYPGRVYSVVLGLSQRENKGGGSKTETGTFSLQNDFWFSDHFALETELEYRNIDYSSGAEQDIISLMLDFVARF